MIRLMGKGRLWKAMVVIRLGGVVGGVIDDSSAKERAHRVNTPPSPVRENYLGKRSGPGRKGNLPGPLRRGYTAPVRWRRLTAFKEKAERRKKEGNLSVR